MIVPGVESVARMAVGQVVNSLPEGLLIAALAWLVLRVLGRENSGTRFAVWMVALVGVAGLPFLGGSSAADLAVRMHAPVTVPGGWAVGFAAIWAVAACVALARVGAGLWQVRRLRRRSRKIAAAELDPALEAAIRQTGRDVALLVSDEVRVPAAIGFLKPAVVLPAWILEDFGAAELRPILIHELAHLRRRDDWTNLLQKTVRAILFFHPAVWWIDARLSMEREMACDDAVVTETGNPRGYAGCLIGLLEKSCARRGWTMAQAAVARARDASVRIARILRGGTTAGTRVGRRALALAGAACVTCFGVLVSTPRLLVFAPEHGAALQAELRPENLAAARLSADEVVPAAFHPAERPMVLPRETRRRAAKAPARRPAETLVAGQREADPVVMASYPAPARHENRTATAAVVIAVEWMQATAPAAALVESDTGVPATADAQTGAVKADAQGGVLQVQTLQIVEGDATGVRFRMVRLVLVMPVPSAAEGSTRRSI